MPAPRECLTAAELVALHLGDLPEAELARVAAHLETAAGARRPPGLDGLSDPTLAAYRQSALAGPLPDAEALPDERGRLRDPRRARPRRHGGRVQGPAGAG